VVWYNKFKKMKSTNLQILAKYEDQYVALSDDNQKVLASAKTIKELHTELKKIKEKNITIDYIPPLNVSISPVCQ